MSHHLAELLEQGIREVRHGRTTPEEFLARHPAEAETLAPLLRLASHIDARAAPAPAPQSRARITARVRAGIEPSAATRQALARYRPWLVAAAIAAVAFTGLGGSGLAARTALPGDPLYGVKRGMERLEPVLRREDAVDRHIRLSERRLGEVQALAHRRDHQRLPTALAAYEQEYLRLLQAAATAPPQPAERAVRHAAAQIAALAALRGQDDDPTLAALVDRLGELTAGLAAVPTDVERQSAARAAAASTAAGTAAATPTAEPEAVGALRRAIDEAQRSGVLAAEQADELRRLLAATAAREDGPRSGVATVLERLADAIAACAERDCTDPATLTALHEAVTGGALALGMPPPAPPRPRTPAAAHADNSVAPPPPARSSPQAAAPAPRATAAARSNPTPPPTSAPPPPAPRVPPAVSASPAAEPPVAPPPRATVPAPPLRPPAAAVVTSTPTTTAAPAVPGSPAPALAAATAATAPQPALPRPVSSPTPSATPTPTPTPTTTPTGTPEAGR